MHFDKVFFVPLQRVIMKKIRTKRDLNRLWAALAFLLLACFFIWDISDDIKNGSFAMHFMAEGALVLINLGIFFYFLHQFLRMEKQLVEKKEALAQQEHEASEWKKTAQNLQQGLSLAIDQQLTRWELSVAEKDIAFLLIKGLSTKEIAEMRNTSERTVRQQATTIYRKAGLEGRAQLAAYFIEDLLVPPNP